ncbi:MAG TPA: redoxin domain-containing protein [Chloroflexota bacterium]
MSRKLAIRLLIILVLCGSIVAGLLMAAPRHTAAQTAPVVGKLAPPFRLQNVKGQDVSLQQYRGRPVLISFFATWCVPCRQELPMISHLYGREGDRFAVLAVDDYGESAGDIAQFASSLHLAFSPLVDPSQSVKREYRTIARPQSFWVDKNGKVRAIDFELDATTVQNRLRQLGV